MDSCLVLTECFSRRILRLWALKPVYHTSWVALVTPTDRPKSVRNRCLIELFCGVVCVVTCPFDISVGVGAFVIGLGQISSFLSLERRECLKMFLLNNCFPCISAIIKLHTQNSHESRICRNNIGVKQLEMFELIASGSICPVRTSSF